MRQQTRDDSKLPSLSLRELIPAEVIFVMELPRRQKQTPDQTPRAWSP